MMAGTLPAVSIVCVWNDESVRRDCLDRSIEALRATTHGVEYVPVDNRGQVHTTAGSALNHGVQRATGECVAFVQQDIYLHSLAALTAAARRLVDDPRLGLVGAVGTTHDGRLLGRVRDRVVLLGDRAATPVEVDSVDEVLFVARRSLLLKVPISQDPALAWHAYAVELGLRLRTRGLVVAALDIPMTHNSRSTNIARLDEAHAAVARAHPALLPVTTTCGTVSLPPKTRRRVLLPEQRWRLRWLRGSLAARRAQHASRCTDLLLSDLRWDVDRLCERLDGRTLHIHNVTAPDAPFPDPADGTPLRRGTHRIVFTSGSLRDGLLHATDRPTVLANLDLAQLGRLRSAVRDTSCAVGYAREIGYWVLIDPEAHHVAAGLRTSGAARPSRLLV
jgi:hypothetical protein